MVEQDIALAIEQLERLRELHKNQMRSLLRAECYLDTELMQLKSQTPRWSLDSPPERERLHHRLSALDAERRQQLAVYADKLHGLHEKLLSSIQKHGHVIA